MTPQDDRRRHSGSVLVTGASGFIGKHVVKALVTRGHDVITIGRSGTDGGQPGDQLRVDYASRSDLEGAMAGCDSVVHLAGRAHVLRGIGGREEAAYAEANVRVTEAVATAAAASGVRRFVLLSSVGAIASSSSLRLRGDETPRPETPYGRSKLMAEQVLTAVATGTGMQCVILRPPMVYGPGMRGNPLRLYRLVARRIPLPFGAVHNQRSVLFVGNLAAAIVRVVEAPPTTVTSFIRDVEEPSTPQLIEAIGRALDVPVKLVPVPSAVLRFAGTIGDALPVVIPFPLTKAAVRGLTESLLLDASPLEAAVGQWPVVSLGEGLRISARWYGGSQAGS